MLKGIVEARSRRIIESWLLLLQLLEAVIQAGVVWAPTSTTAWPNRTNDGHSILGRPEIRHKNSVNPDIRGT